MIFCFCFCFFTSWKQVIVEYFNSRYRCEGNEGTLSRSNDFTFHFFVEKKKTENKKKNENYGTLVLYF